MGSDEITDSESDIKVTKVDLFDETKIVEFNSFFANVGKNLLSKIANVSTPFEYFVSKSDFVMETKAPSINELKDAFYSLKSDKGPDYNDISYNAIKKCFDSFYEPLKHLFNLSIEKGVFPDNLIIARVTSIYKGIGSSDVVTIDQYLCSHAFSKHSSALLCPNL